MFDFWFELPPRLRALMGLGLMAIAVGIFYFTGGSLITYGLFIVGLVFLLLARSGDSGGYNF